MPRDAAGHSTSVQEMESNPHLGLLGEAAGLLLAADDPQQAVTALFEFIADRLRLDAYFNYLIDGEQLRLFSSAGLDEETRRAGEVLAVGAAVCGQVAETRQADYVAGIQRSTEPRTEFLRLAGLDAYACTPMMVSGRLLGTLGFGRRGRGDFTQDELQFLRTATYYVAMALERLRTETALLESQRRLNAVLDNASVAIFLIDERQHCTYMNAAAEALTGYRLDETQGRPLHDVVHHTRPDGSHFPIEACPIDRAFPENNQEQGEEVFVHRDGHFYNVAFTASPIRDEASRTIGTILEVRDITQDKRNEQQRELLMREVDHRARNALSMVQAIVQLTQAPNIEAYREAVLGRVSALGRVQGSLAASYWEGASANSVVMNELRAISKAGQFSVEGEDLLLSPSQAQPLGMVFHELATNALKHGSLGAQDGHVEVRWKADGDTLEFVWREIDGPPVEPPARFGFGSKLIESLTRQAGGALSRDWRAEGLEVRLRLPLSSPSG